LNYPYPSTGICKRLLRKRIALRADKTDQSFMAMIHLTAAVMNSRLNFIRRKGKEDEISIFSGRVDNLDSNGLLADMSGGGK
jgi:hypothetical protein